MAKSPSASPASTSFICACRRFFAPPIACCCRSVEPTDDAPAETPETPVRKAGKRKARRDKETIGRRRAVAATPVTAAELRALKREVSRRAATLRWNPEPEDVQKSVAQLVLTIVEFLRKLMERQAIRRMEQKTLTKKEVEAVGAALMKLEETIRDIGRRFGLTPRT